MKTGIVILAFFFFNFLNAQILNIESKEEIIDNQTGMGIALGLVAKYDFKFGMSLFANPFVRLHSLVHFASGKNHPNRLFDGGIRFGITYDFNKR